MQTEKQIVESVRKGEREGQDEMFRRYANQVFSMIVKQVPDVMDAQELTQDTFLKAFRYIDRYDARQSSLSTWLCRIAYRLTLDFLKRRRPIVVSIEDSSVWLEAALSTGNEQRIEQLQELVQQLPNEEQMLLTLYYFDDLPLKEIAYITDADPKALAVRLYRIRRKLYNSLTANL